MPGTSPQPLMTEPSRFPDAPLSAFSSRLNGPHAGGREDTGSEPSALRGAEDWLAGVPTRRGARWGDGGHAAGGVRGEGAGGGQRAGSRRGGLGLPRPGPPSRSSGAGARVGLGLSPAVCISLAGGGAGVERNRPRLERCLFFLTSQRRQTTPRARRPDLAGPAPGKGQRGDSPCPRECARVPAAGWAGRVGPSRSSRFLALRTTVLLLPWLP